MQQQMGAPLETTNFHIAKKRFLEHLLQPIAPSLEEAISKIDRLCAIFRSNALLTPDRAADVYGLALYEKESKARILSLLIYVLGLTSAILVMKLADPDILLELVFNFDYSQLFGIAAVAAILFLLLLYPGALLYSLLVVPALMYAGKQGTLVRHLLAQAAYYCYMQDKSAPATYRILTMLKRKQTTPTAAPGEFTH